MRTPCQDDPELWVSDFPDLRVEAVKGCTACPVLAECRAGMFGKPGPGDFGVWAGVDYSRESVTAVSPFTECAREGCTNTFTQPRVGKRRVYCSKACHHVATGPKPISHGTQGGYRTHQRRGEKPCESCAAAYVVARSERRRKRKEVAA